MSTKVRRGSKSKSLQQFNAVTSLWSLASFSRPDDFCPQAKKICFPTSQQSNIVYEFSCHCDSRYVGRTSQRLQDRIKQHIPKSVRTGQFSQDRAAFNRSCKLTNHEPICDSATGHLLTNQLCGLHYSDDRFSILWTGSLTFHLSA